ncbi:MAG TPA: hypothetical protein VNI83_09710 [Vicinamibacterales bacterium]|nr:hypothetical protein [Vicinamibacterales bacterium]
MSLKYVHLAFIALAAALAVFFGIWAMVTAGAGWGSVTAAAAFATAAALVLYARKFARKARRL